MQEEARKETQMTKNSTRGMEETRNETIMKKRRYEEWRRPENEPGVHEIRKEDLEEAWGHLGILESWEAPEASLGTPRESFGSQEGPQEVPAASL